VRAEALAYDAFESNGASVPKDDVAGHIVLGRSAEDLRSSADAAVPLSDADKAGTVTRRS
jgi:hypothetical protein